MGKYSVGRGQYKGLRNLPHRREDGIRRREQRRQVVEGQRLEGGGCGEECSSERRGGVALAEERVGECEVGQTALIKYAEAVRSWCG